MTILLIIIGISSYTSMPKESFPEIVMPQIFVKTIYPGNPPADIENLITRPLEKEIHVIKGIKTMKSTSTQGNSDIFIEFNSDIDPKNALQDVKDAADKANSELPNDLTIDPIIMDLDFSEFPVITINLSGNYSTQELKKFAEDLQDEFENINEISKVELKGISEREIEIDVDPYKLEAYELAFSDIENAIASENISISGGDLKIGKTRRSVRVIGEFDKIEQMKNIIVKNEKGNIVYLRDLATVSDTFEDPLSIARLNKQNVVSMQVVKKSGENLIAAVDKLQIMLADAKKSGILPADVSVFITNDQSEKVRSMVKNLENSIIMGMIFVIWVLYFFLGYRNALFVGLAIPISMFISFLTLNLMGSTINMMVLFGLVLALGMLVDNAIVVVENIHRFVNAGFPLFKAAKQAVGEIAFPIIASTATTLAAFIPLAFWPGMMGEFMKHQPITLIIVLTSSLFVALVIIPVFATVFISPDGTETAPDRKKIFIATGIMLAISTLLYLLGSIAFANFIVLIAFIVFMHFLVFYKLSQWFQHVFLVWLEDAYLKVLTYSLKRPTLMLLSTVGLLFFTIFLLAVRSPKVILFPENDPEFINITVELPVGSDIEATDEISQQIENQTFRFLEEHHYMSIVESILTTIGKGAVGENETPIGNTPNKSIITVNFIDFEDRNGIQTTEILKMLSAEITNTYPGVRISVMKNKMGPPTGKPVNIEISGKEFEKLIKLTDTIQQVIERENIWGIEGLTLDLDLGKPELIVNIDRDKARRLGLSTAQIATTIRTSLFGKEISDFKVGEDKYPIQLRMKRRYRNDISELINQKISFKNKRGEQMQIPVASVASFTYSNSYSAVKRIDMNRVITLSSNILEGANAAEINQKIRKILANFKMPEGYKSKLTGEQEEQEKQVAFLSKALMIALAVIVLILVTQFNSISKPLIIMASVLFSTIGVFGGIATFKMNFVIIMTGIGIISLAGIVVNNAIVLIDYIDFLKRNRKEELEMEEDGNLPINEIVTAIINGGKTRLRPVLLTAITTVLGLIPMATGMNIDFAGALSHFEPQIYFGGDNANFWGPMAWTVIFGLTFSTFLTLIIVPVMYLIGNKIKLRFAK